MGNKKTQESFETIIQRRLFSCDKPEGILYGIINRKNRMSRTIKPVSMFISPQPRRKKRG